MYHADCMEHLLLIVLVLSLLFKLIYENAEGKKQIIMPRAESRLFLFFLLELYVVAIDKCHYTPAIPLDLH